MICGSGGVGAEVWRAKAAEARKARSARWPSMKASTRSAMRAARAGSSGTPNKEISRAVAGPCATSPAAIDSQRWTWAAATGSSGSQALSGA